MSPVVVQPGSFATEPKSSPALPTDIPRRPSPWHDLAHSLSTSAFSNRRVSSSSLQPVSVSLTSDSTSSPSSPQLSSSQALQEWEERLSHPTPSVQRHTLIQPPSPHLHLEAAGKTTTPPLIAKLAAERDKAGHIEYKLKLIEPSQERFERLVTQMTWRLKEGRNEAIYEIGLADDGTVIGLTRSEMDASLHTLELMASEVGATVLILKEIVIAARPLNYTSSHSSLTRLGGPSHTPLQSTSTSIGWVPQSTIMTDERGWDTKQSTRRSKRAGQTWTSRTPDKTKERQLVFDPAELAAVDLDESDDEVDKYGDPIITRRAGTPEHVSDDEIPPFHLDLDNSLPASPPSSSVRRSRRKWPRRRHPRPTVEDEQEVRRKSDVKVRKAAEKREARRLDLLKGDGLSAVSSTPWDTTQALLPHQPSRPSSLRLTTPDADSSPDDACLHGLLHLPLDSLSLSFADVQTVVPFSSSSSSSSTEYEAAPEDTELLEGDELICVEALVVRKTGVGEGETGDVWYGGAEDGWGFGCDEDDEDEVEETYRKR